MDDTVVDRLDDNPFRKCINEVGFTVRTENCLLRSGYKYVDEIMSLTEVELISIRNMGRKSVKEVLDFISNSTSMTSNDVLPDVCENVNVSFANYSKFIDADKIILSVRAKNVLYNNGINNLYELSKFNLSNVRNAGSKTILEIKSYIKSIKDDFFDYCSNDRDIPEKYTFEKIYSFMSSAGTYYEDLDITVGEAYTDYLNKKNIILKFNNKKDFATFIFFKDLAEDRLASINDLVSSLKIEIKLTAEDIDIFFARGRGETLESLGTQYGVTRERIRQKDVKYVQKVKKIYDKAKIKNLFNQNVINIDKNETVLSDDNYALLTSRLNELDEDYVRVEWNSNVIMVLKKYFTDCSRFVEEIELQIQKNDFVYSESITTSSFNEILLSFLLDEKQIIVYDDYAIFKTTKRGKTAVYLEKVKMIDISSQEKLDAVISDINRTFNMEIDSERVLRSYLEDCAYSIGNGMFVPYSIHPIIPDVILEEMFGYIESQKTVNCKLLYLKYKSYIENMLSPTHLYLYLKKTYPTKYNYGGNNNTISKIGYEASNAALVYEFIKECNGPVDGSEVMLKVGIDNIALSVIVKQNQDIFRLNNNNDYYLISKLIDKELLVKTIDDYIMSLSRERIYLRDIFIYLYNSNDKLLSDNYIYSMEELLTIINVLKVSSLCDYKYDKNSKQFIKEKKIMDMFGDEI